MTRTVLLTALLVTAACSSGLEPEERPSSARIRAEGTAPGQLELIVSTQFYAVEDAVTLEVSHIVESADTFLIDLPYENTVDVSSTGSVYVNLANPDSVPANVRLRVNLDSGQQAYDQTATMSEGGALRYVFLFLQVIV